MTGTQAIFPRLGVMMFLQFFIWGAWFVSITGWLNISGLSAHTAVVYSLCPIAAILSPLFVGVVADRYLPARTVLAGLHLLGAVFILAIPDLADTDSSFLIPLLLAHALCYMPTLGLVNAVIFPFLNNPEKTFPLIRVCGTFGWIAGNVAVTLLPGGDQSSGQFYLAGGAGLLLTLFVLTFPSVKPSTDSKFTFRTLFGLDALQLLKDRGFLVFILCSFFLCIVLSGYYQQARNFVDFAQIPQPTLIMSLGQVSEILCMFLLPIFLSRLGIKKILTIAMLAWALRYSFFGMAAGEGFDFKSSQAFILGGILLHGICYDFFFVAGQIYIDKNTPAIARGQAQCFFVLVTWGAGMLFGAYAFGALVAASSNWQTVWFCAAGLAAVIAALFSLVFREKFRE
jgi:nucleoside transporter